MMHLVLILVTVALAYSLRCSWQGSGSYAQRWQQGLIRFLVPALLPVMTAIALVCMGPSGHMVLRWEGWITFGLAWGFLVLGLGWGLKLAIAGWQTVVQVRTYPQQRIQGYASRILAAPVLFSAQIGFWQPELVISQGLIDVLDPDHLQAVLVHEMGHRHYRDTFWFFILGWLGRLTAWLPQTEALWEELLLLREIRADHWAAQQVDQLLLAESLLQVAEAPLVESGTVTAAFSCAVPGRRLQERIDALLSETQIQSSQFDQIVWRWLLLASLPLLVVPFHY